MRFQGAICCIAIVLAPAQAMASSIVTLGSSGNAPASSILVLPVTPPNEMSSVVTIGNPTADNLDGANDITVIRGGEIGGPLPPQESLPQPNVEPMLDPNDRGTPAKRNALKRQAERLAAEEAARQNAQPTP